MIADIFRAAIFVAAHLLGGSIGAGVLAASFMLRLALLPLTLRLARRALAQQRILESIQPEVVAIRQRYRDDPQQQWRKLRALYERAGYRPFNASTVFGNLVQLPVVGAVHSALRRGFPAPSSFLWIPDLARADLLLAAAVAVVSGVASYVGAHAGGAAGRAPITAAYLTGLGTLLFCSRDPAALVLSWAASSVTGVVQARILAREQRRLDAAA